MFQIKAKLLYNRKIKNNYFHCAFVAATIARSAEPGQFVDIKVSDTLEPLLRRPFSIHRLDGKRVELLYEVIGKGTEILSKKKTGNILDVIGPLGSGFIFNERTRERENKRTILVAGGMGVAPLMFLSEKLTGFKIQVLIGAKNKNKIICSEEFRKLGCEVKIATDDGSIGFKGKVTELLKKIVSTMDYGLSTIYACGPRPMLKQIAFISKQYNIPAQISLEEHMACGIGACLGCAVNTKQAFKRVCKEGPVFDADEIVWE